MSGSQDSEECSEQQFWVRVWYKPQNWYISKKKDTFKIIETLYMSGHEHRQETGTLYENIASQNEKSFLVAPGNFKV